MKQEYISYWQNTLQHSQKLEFIDVFELPIATSFSVSIVHLQVKTSFSITIMGSYTSENYNRSGQ